MKPNFRFLPVAFAIFATAALVGLCHGQASGQENLLKFSNYFNAATKEQAKIAAKAVKEALVRLPKK